MSSVATRRTHLLPGAEHPECRALVAACLDNPVDVARRGVLRDWCEDRGLDRAVESLKLSAYLFEAANNPAFDWQPRTTTSLEAMPGPPSSRTQQFMPDHRCEPWFDGINRRGKAHYARLFAVAAGRIWFTGQPRFLPSFIGRVLQTLAACEVSAAGLLDPLDRDDIVLQCHNQQANPDLQSMILWARSAKFSSIEGGIVRSFRALENRHSVSYWLNPAAKIRPYRMVGALRRHLGLKG